MDYQVVLKSVADALEVSPDTLKPETVLQALPDYDSIRVLTLMVALDEIGVTVGQNEVASLKTFGDVIAIAEARMPNKKA